VNPGLTPAILPSLRPGDLLLYRRKGFWCWVIKVKTWSEIIHVETYLGDGIAHAARECSGVGRFPIEFDGLVAVRRPITPFDLTKAQPYLNNVNGQGYDYFGLLRFFTYGKQNTTKQFCSEDATRLARHAGVEPFTPETDADLVSPSMLNCTPAYKTIFRFKE
jgi:hypothetical protein